jgi:hypothetical protein
MINKKDLIEAIEAISNTLEANGLDTFVLDQYINNQKIIIWEEETGEGL